MTQAQNITISLLILYGFLAAGYVARRRRPELVEGRARMLRTALLFFDCPVMALTFWLLSPDARAGAWQLPVLGTLLAMLVGVVGLAVARGMRLERQAEGAFVCGTSMSNIGFTFGGLICLLFLGIDGLTLSQVYALYMTPYAFLIMFQVAAGYSRTGMRAPGRAMLREFFGDPTRAIPVATIVAGLGLNLWGPRPPEWVKPMVTVWVLAATAFYSFAIGVGVRFGDVRKHLRTCMALSAVKFVITPAIALGLMCLFHLTPLQKQVVFIESAAPMAIYAVVLAGLTGIAPELASSCWIFTTVAALPVMLPVYLIVTRWL